MAIPKPDNAVLARLQQQILNLPPQEAAQEIPKVEDIIQKDAKNPQHWFVIGLLLMRAGAVPQSINALLQANKLFDSSEIILGSIAYIYAERIGDHEEALTYLERKLQLNPTDAQSLFMMANCQLNLGNPQAAIELLDRAGQQGGNSAKVEALKAQCHVRAGDSAAARQCYEKVQELDPEAAFAMLDKIAMLPDNTPEQLSELKAELSDVLANKPEKFRTEEHRVAFYTALGNVNERLELYDEAFESFKSANECQKTFAQRTEWGKAFELLKKTFTSEIF